MMVCAGWCCVCWVAGANYFSSANRMRRRSLSNCADRLAQAGLELSAGKTGSWSLCECVDEVDRWNRCCWQLHWAVSVAA